MSLSAIFVVAFLLSPLFASAQHCPSAADGSPGEAKLSSKLRGEVVFHDSLRKWLELQPAKAVCEKPSIELVRFSGDYKEIERLRGCNVETEGSIGESPTGYYSLDLYQNVETIRPIGRCAVKALPDDHKGSRPSPSVLRYNVSVTLDSRPGDHPPLFAITDAKRKLTPWQAYASYSVTGGFVLYGACGKGFVVDRVFGAPETSPSHFAEPRTEEDKAAFDAEGSESHPLQKIGYTCVRLRK